MSKHSKIVTVTVDARAMKNLANGAKATAELASAAVMQSAGTVRGSRR